MATIVEQRFFSLANIDERNNKFWNITLYDDMSVECHWGSQGATGQRKTFPNGGRLLFDKKIREKTAASHHGGAYVENKVLEATRSSAPTARNVVGKHELAKKAINDMGASSPELADLIHYFAQVNEHNLHEASGGKITYDTSAGKFRTTQGIISLDQINDARVFLGRIADCAEKGDFESKGFKAAVGSYLSLVPQKGLVRQMHFPSMFSVDHGLVSQNDILDALESSYADVIAAPAPKDDGKKKTDDKPMFRVTLNHVDDQNEFRTCRALYQRTKGSHYDVQDYDVKKVFKLCIQHMHDAFESRGRQLGNIMRLWHGTKASNMLSILKVGMIIPGGGGSIHVTGRMFGDGLYFSDQSTKSIRYATGAWGGGGGHDRKFMFLVDVAMGKAHVPSGPFGGGCKLGFDSTFAQGHRSGVANNEMIVYKLHQADPVYLLEFTPFGR